MSFIVPTEKRHWRTKLLYAGMYFLATIGALSTVYPFVLMVSGSLKSTVDFEEFEIIPAFLSDDQVLYRKYVQARYNNIAYWQRVVGSMLQGWDEVQYPRDYNRGAAEDVEQFIASPDCPRHRLALGQTSEPNGQPRMLRRWRAFLSKRFGSDIVDINRALGTNYESWDRVPVPTASFWYRSNRWGSGPSDRLCQDEFRATQPLYEFWPIPAEGIFYCFVWQLCGGDIAKLNAQHGTSFASLDEIPLPRTYPTGQPCAALWEGFIRNKNLGINMEFLRLRPSSRQAYLETLRQRYPTIHDYNRAYCTSLDSFSEIRVPESVPADAVGFSDYLRFMETGDCLPHVEIDSFEYRWRDWLKRKYGTIEACSAAHGRQYASFDLIPFKPTEYDAYVMLKHRGEIVREFLVRNYLHVFDFIFRHGNAFKVTSLYVGLMVLLHLLINPLAAYALSRYRLRVGHWVLLFCVLTTAFPAEVGSIPRFLLIRELGLLNTIWALVLPGVAHGFSIFILKSFFDGLPQELYEASMIEGASESWMFRNVTLALTKPILAVTAFGAFVSAYGAFLFALIIAPDERMWTISVWLYQFQQRATEPARFASLVVSSIPVLAAFLVMQRFILRGIVLPVER